MYMPDIDAWRKYVIFVVGDVMLDKFVYGQVERISPEGPIPVLHFSSEMEMLGGAANVARNVVSLGGKAILVGVIGQDEAGDRLAGPLMADVNIEGRFVRTNASPTIVKTRYVSGGQQIMRLDVEKKLEQNLEITKQICQSLEEVIDRVDVVVLSDYGKGVLSSDLVQKLIAVARAHAVPVIVDPKTSDVARYSGASIITPNALEAASITNRSCKDDADVAMAAREIRTLANVDSVIVTRGSMGMTIFDPGQNGESPVHIPTSASEVFDVSGAGDTVVAALALTVADAAQVVEGAKVANVAAGISVSKRGTATVYPNELMKALRSVSSESNPKVASWDEARDTVLQWKQSGLTVGFTNGCFDLIHPGHVQLLQRARAACDKLVVALNSDDSVRRLKGSSRPVQTELARSIVMASIGSVDLVVLFDGDTPIDLIETLRPDVLVKGADYTVETVVGSDVVMSYGGRVHLVPLEEGHSTTSIISRANS